MAGRDQEISACPTPPELGDFLGGVEYPASRDELIAHVEGAGAPVDVRQVLEALEPQLFESAGSVERAVQGLSR
jgi:hypothetical protein